MRKFFSILSILLIFFGFVGLVVDMKSYADKFVCIFFSFSFSFLCISPEFLYLEENQLSGQIPTEMGNMFLLEVFHFFNNALTGSMPNEVCNVVTISGSVFIGNCPDAPDFPFICACCSDICFPFE